MLRDYQADICSRITEAFARYRSVMVQMPTGTGKTHVLASVVNEECRRVDEPKRVMKNEELPFAYGRERRFNTNVGGVWLVAHRRELVAQIEKIIGRMLSSATTSSSATNSSFFILYSSFIKVVSIQWLSRHLEEIEGEPSLVIIDEAHHALAKTYRILWDKWPNAKFLGLTATPYRLNGTGFSDLFDTLLCSFTVPEFIRKGVLSAFDYVSVSPDSKQQKLVDSLVKRGMDGDYQLKEMNTVLNVRTSIEDLYRSYSEYGRGKKGIVYAVSIGHANNIADCYRGHGVKAVVVSSSTPAAERVRHIADFRSGKTDVLVNVDIFSEGFDCPDVEFIQLARPTLSLSKYLQMVGRGLRPYKGKTCCMIIDNVGLHRVFGLPTRCWDWEAFFNGTGMIKDRKRRCSACETDTCNGMEVVVRHEELKELIDKGQLETRNERLGVKEEKLVGFKDETTRLWGLKRGGDIKVPPRYLRVFDVRDGMATVRFGDISLGVVDERGAVIRNVGRHDNIRMVKDGIIAVAKYDKCTRSDRWETIDIMTGKKMSCLGKVEHVDWIEVLTCDNRIILRTENGIDTAMCKGSVSFKNHGFYMTVVEYDAMKYELGGKMVVRKQFCILRNDKYNPYYLCEEKVDGSIVIMDERFTKYVVEKGRGIVRI